MADLSVAYVSPLYPSSSPPTYGRVAWQVVRTRGPASAHTCSARRCPNRAVEWASPPGDLTSHRGWSYSDDPATWEPRCCSHLPGLAVVPSVGSTESPSVVARRHAQLCGANIRRVCAECGMESNSGGLAVHQKASGHSGWTKKV